MKVSRYIAYNPDQVWLLPPSVREELGEKHLSVFVHEIVEKLNLKQFEDEDSNHGRPGYPPQLLLKVWLYAYATGVTSSRRIEQKIREDLGYRLLAGDLKPDHWTINEFRKRHPKAINDVFTQVIEAARGMGLAKLGRVAIDSTRVQANASPDKRDTGDELRRERARIRQRIRRWQKKCNEDNATAETASPAVEQEHWKQRLAEIPRQLQELRKSGKKNCSRTDPESRLLHRRGGFCQGYTAEVAVSDDHLIVAQRVHQADVDNHSLSEMTTAVERECGQLPEVVLADSGYYSMPLITEVEAKKVVVYVPDGHLARELNGGTPLAPMNARQRREHPGLQEQRDRLRAERTTYARRKALVEPVFGVLKQQRGMRQFRCRGLSGVGTEWALAATAFNVTRLFTMRGTK